jgi:hypothetical protein
VTCRRLWDPVRVSIPSWVEFDRDAPRPSLPELTKSWQTVRWEQVPILPSALDTYVAEVRSIYVNGDCLVARFRALSYSEVAAWFVSRWMSEEYELFRLLFESQAFRDAFPQLQVPVGHDRVPGGLARESMLMLDGYLAQILVHGGAYTTFRGSAARAKELATAAVDAVTGRRFEDFEVHVSQSPWTGWFYDIAWDHTIVMLNRRDAEVTVICATDTD